MQFKSVFALSLFATSTLVAGHGAIVRAVGDKGGMITAIGIDESTPRDGARRNPHQRDTSRFTGASAAACGNTLESGANPVGDRAVSQLMQKYSNPPVVSQGGMLQMTLHQVNGDGAGPYSCAVDLTGSGRNWTPLPASAIVTNVAGRRGNSRARATDFPLNVRIPESMVCGGNVAGVDNMCMMRCMNPARAGPFGGCVPFVMDVAADSATGRSIKANVNQRQGNRKQFAKREADPSANEEDLMNDPEFVAQLREEGEDF